MGSPFYSLRRVYPPRCLMPPKSHSVLHQPGKRTAVGDKVAHLLRLAVRRFRLGEPPPPALPSPSADGRKGPAGRRAAGSPADAALLPAAHVGEGPVQPVAAGLIAVKGVQQIIIRLVLKRTLRQQPAGRGLNKAGDVDRPGKGQGCPSPAPRRYQTAGWGEYPSADPSMLSIMLV